MKHRYLALSLGAIIASSLILVSSCKKINAVTELGGNLIPAVDNITTFDTTLTVEAYNHLFTLGGTDPLAEDSTRVSYTITQFLGKITNDPIFGKTDARMFFQVDPALFPYSFGDEPDSLHLDSIVLVLDNVENYGDTIIPQTVNVYEIDQSSDFRLDSGYLVRRNDL